MFGYLNKIKGNLDNTIEKKDFNLVMLLLWHLRWITLEWERSRGCAAIRLYNWAWLKENIYISYVNKMHLFFSSLSLKNYTVKCVWLELVMGWVTFWEVFSKFCDEDKTCWKVLYWFVGIVISLESSQSKLSKSRKGLPTEGSDW